MLPTCLSLRFNAQCLLQYLDRRPISGSNDTGTSTQGHHKHFYRLTSVALNCTGSYNNYTTISMECGNAQNTTLVYMHGDVSWCMYVASCCDSLLQLLLWPEIAGVTTLLLTTVVCTRVQPSIAPAVWKWMSCTCISN